jgi:drug/metabolite transporter (DMT)-like permease
MGTWREVTSTAEGSPAIAAATQRASRRAGIVAVCVGTVAWGSANVLVKWSSLPALRFAMVRLWAGVAISAIALLATRRRLRWATFRACALGGVIFAADISLGFTAVKHTSVANASLIGSLSTLVIAVVSARMLRERVHPSDWALIGASLAGVAIVALGASGSPVWSPFGDLLAFISVGTWSVYWFFSRRARRDTNAIEYMACVMLAAAIVITPLALLVDGAPSIPHGRDWVALLTVALVPGFVGHTLVAWSHRHVESWLSALITQCSPVISAVGAWVVVGESIPPLVVVGGMLVLAATGVVVVRATKRQPEAELEDAVERVS